MLNEQVTLIAEILSFVLEDTQQVAKLRRVSKDWNSNVLPFCLKNAGFLRNCSTSEFSYVKELVTFGEASYAGRFYRLHDRDVFGFWVKPDNEGEDITDWVVSKTLLMVSDDAYNTDLKVVAEKQKGYTLLRDSAQEFANFCQKISETQSWDEFQELTAQAVARGMFLCVQDLEKAKAEGAEVIMKKGQWGTYLPVILSIDIPRHGVQIVDMGTGSIALLKAKVPKGDGDGDSDGDGHGPFPFVHFEDIPDLNEDGHDGVIFPTFAGYNVIDNGNGTISCQVPLALQLSDGLEDLMWDWDNTDSYLPLDCLWRKCQEQHIREGVAIADGMVPQELRENLMSQIDSFAKEQIVDYHPHSNDIVRDIVHPALYSYVKGVSALLLSEEELAALLHPTGTDEEEQHEVNPFDYWGRPYEASAKYQWLPAYFDVGLDGNCSICDYINNLVPRSKYEDLYTSLSQLFSQMLPLIESVYGYCRTVKENHIRIEEDEELDYDDGPLEAIEETPTSLRGKQLQVITKIVDYELSPGQTYEGVWHVEGMSHEEIVATAIYFIDRDDEIEGGDILYKRAFHKQEAEYIFSSVDQMRPREVERIISEGLQPLGQVKTLEGRLLVFPNSHVHKVTTLMNIAPQGTEKKKRRIIVFFIINPKRRIVSSREVPIQQEHAGGKMDLEEAKAHRLELMRERKFTKQDWNVREIELCEH